MIILATIVFYTFVILFFPHICADAVTLSYTLTTTVLLPALLPSVILSKVLVQSKPDHYCRTMLLSFLIPLCIISGVPSCIIILEDAYKNNVINLLQYKSLYILLSNVSFSFVFNYICKIDYHIPVWLILIIFYLSPLINSLVYYFVMRNKLIHNNVMNSYQIYEKPDKSASGKYVFNRIIISSILTICNIFVYLSMCIIIIKVLSLIIHNNIIIIFLSAFIEIISSCNLIKDLDFSLQKFIVLILSISFGGMCSIFQMKGVMQNDDIGIMFMIKTKMLNAITALSIGLTIYLIMYYNY